MTDRLFSTYDLGATIEKQGQVLAGEVNSLSENEVLNTSHEDMVKYLVEKHRINPLVIDESGIPCRLRRHSDRRKWRSSSRHL